MAKLYDYVSQEWKDLIDQCEHGEGLLDLIERRLESSPYTSYSKIIRELELLIESEKYLAVLKELHSSKVINIFTNLARDASGDSLYTDKEAVEPRKDGVHKLFAMNTDMYEEITPDAKVLAAILVEKGERYEEVMSMNFEPTISDSILLEEFEEEEVDSAENDTKIKNLDSEEKEEEEEVDSAENDTEIKNLDSEEQDEESLSFDNENSPELESSDDSDHKNDEQDMDDESFSDIKAETEALIADISQSDDKTKDDDQSLSLEGDFDSIEASDDDFNFSSIDDESGDGEEDTHQTSTSSDSNHVEMNEMSNLESNQNLESEDESDEKEELLALVPSEPIKIRQRLHANTKSDIYEEYQAGKDILSLSIAYGVIPSTLVNTIKAEEKRRDKENTSQEVISHKSIEHFDGALFDDKFNKIVSLSEGKDIFSNDTEELASTSANNNSSTQEVVEQKNINDRASHNDRSDASEIKQTSFETAHKVTHKEESSFSHSLDDGLSDSDDEEREDHDSSSYALLSKLSSIDKKPTIASEGVNTNIDIKMAPHSSNEEKGLTDTKEDSKKDSKRFDNKSPLSEEKELNVKHKTPKEEKNLDTSTSLDVKKKEDLPLFAKDSNKKLESNEESNISSPKPDKAKDDKAKDDKAKDDKAKDDKAKDDKAKDDKAKDDKEKTDISPFSKASSDASMFSNIYEDDKKVAKKADSKKHEPIVKSPSKLVFMIAAVLIAIVGFVVIEMNKNEKEVISPKKEKGVKNVTIKDTVSLPRETVNALQAKISELEAQNISIVRERAAAIDNALEKQKKELTENVDTRIKEAYASGVADGRGEAAEHNVARSVEAEYAVVSGECDVFGRNNFIDRVKLSANPVKVDRWIVSAGANPVITGLEATNPHLKLKENVTYIRCRLGLADFKPSFNPPIINKNGTATPD